MMNLNKPRLNLSPTVKIISSAIDLCAAFGQKDEGMMALLNDMKEVQEYNQDVLKGANDSYINATKANLDLDKREKTMADKFAEQNSMLTVRAAEITSREVVLAKMRTSFDNLKRGTLDDLKVKEKAARRDREEITIELRDVILKSSEVKLLEKRTKQANRESEARTEKMSRIVKQITALMAGL